MKSNLSFGNNFFESPDAQSVAPKNKIAPEIESQIVSLIKSAVQRDPDAFACLAPGQIREGVYPRLTLSQRNAFLELSRIASECAKHAGGTWGATAKQLWKIANSFQTK